MHMKASSTLHQKSRSPDFGSSGTAALLLAGAAPQQRGTPFVQRSFSCSSPVPARASSRGLVPGWGSNRLPSLSFLSCVGAALLRRVRSTPKIGR